MHPQPCDPPTLARTFILQIVIRSRETPPVPTHPGLRGAILACGLLAAALLPAAAEPPAPPVPHLAWAPCADPDQAGFDCAKARVPLDHARPEGESITLSVVRHP